MKTTFTTQHNAASTQNGSHAAHNVYSPLRRLTLLVTLLITFALGARAAEYVITYTNGGTTYYLGMNGNNLQAKTTFDITCVWTCINGNTETTLGNNSRSLRNRNNSSYYLTTSCTRSGYYNYTYTWSSLSVQTTASNIWRSSNSNIYAYYSGSSYGSSWNRSASINVQSLTMIDNNTNSSKNVQVTITDISTTSTNPTINGDNILTAIDDYKYTASGAAYQAGGYSNYRFNNTDHYFDNNNTAITPEKATLNTTWSISTNEYATINSSTGVVTVNRIPTSDITLTITATVSVTGGTPAAPAGTTLVGTKEITIQGSVPAAPTISVSGTTVTLQTDATGTTSIRYTIDGTDPTATTGTVYKGAFDISGSTNSPVTIKAITVRNGNASSVTTQQAKLTLPEPVITVNAATGTATITYSNSSATIYYTTDGSTPSATNGTPYKGQITGLTTMATVKAIAICDGWNSSSVASATVTIPSGVSPEGTVTLFDYEDHKWSYYSDEECPIHSLNPADVKITYYGNGTKTVTNASAAEAVENPTSFSLDATTVKVGPNDDANVFVYYKTLERENVDGTGNVPYTTIPNPFLVRPTGNSSTVTITPTYGTVYLSWSCNYWTYSGAQAEVTYTYTDPDGKQQSGSGTSNGNTTIQVKAGTKVTLTSKGSRAPSAGNNRSNYQPTITAKLNNNTGEQIGSVTSTTTTAKSSETNTVTASPQTITTSTYRGFYAWRVKSKSAGLSITDVNGNSFANNIIPAETEIRFVTSNEYGNEVEFEALWAQAYVTDGTSDLSTRSNSYERNFHVVKSATSASSFQKSYPLTVTSRYPDGTNAGGSVTGEFEASSDTKFENIAITGATNSTWTANGHDLIVGRGCSGTVNSVRGMSGGSSNAVNYTIRLESGTFGTFNMISSSTYTHSSTLSAKTIFGCDYDRAKEDNEKLSIAANNPIYGASSYQSFSGSANRNNLTYDWLIKSGKVQSSKSVGDADADDCIYMGNSGSGSDSDGNRYQGKRRLIMEGGEVCNIAGGLNNYGNNRDNYIVNDGGWTLQIRMKGGTVRGSIYGAAAYAGASGDRLFIFTGGTIGGWVAGGANGTEEDGGVLHGASYLYVGGNTQIDSKASEDVINHAVGGNVFGAGCGYNSGSESGQVTQGTNVIVADGAYVERGVYGGGSYGYTTNTSNIYITGGRIGGVAGGVNGTSYSANIPGGVYGGACQNQGGTVNIYMTGGEVNGGLYGGSNNSGTISNNVTMQINGGQVGTSGTPANIHGGGYGKDTKVNGNVTLTLGSNTTDPGVTVYGDVYGGSALGTVNDANSDRTEVTLNCGTINGSLYGGGLGNATEEANVNGAVTVTVNGGSVKKTSVEGSGGVYGANNINGEPKSSVTVVINGTAPAPSNEEYALYAVYGGGNQADYDYNGGPIVTVNNCENSIEYVYGGGNAAAVKTTNVTIWGGNVIGNVFGGGHGYKDGAGADVEGNVNVAIKGGTIKKVFGGSNSKGNIRGTINLKIDKDGDCDMRIGEVYGGGNEAAGNAGTITIGCTGALVEGSEGHVANPGEIGKTLEGIGAVYGGANNANVTNDRGITLNINSGMVANAFGGNNTGGDITGGITVNINKNANTCGWYVGNVYGAGNQADYTGSPVVNILNGTVSGNVFGGGLGASATVTGNPQVKIGDNTEGHESYVATVSGDVYGGGDAGNVVGIPAVNVVNKSNTSIGNVYGGGNAADVNGTDVNIDGGTITGMVFGGGHGDKNAEPQTEANVKGNVKVDITGGSIGKVFGGSNSKGNITGTIALTIEKNDEHCDMYIAEVYGGGNEADGNAGSLTIGCTGALVEGDNGHVAHPENIGKTLEGIGAVYGGANNANIGNDVTLNINSGMVARVFGGNNTGGSVNGNVTVNVDKDENTCGWYVGKVHGGGYGSQTSVAKNVTVNIKNGTIYGDVYGGSALGKVNSNTTNTTTVNLNGGVIKGDAYGGGLGDSTTEADVNGNVIVTLVGTAFELTTTTDDGGNIIPTSGRIFGCNNINGSPKGTVLVKVLNTVARDDEGNVKAKPTPNSGVYELQAVYGGGNLAAYKPANPMANGQFTSYTWGEKNVAHVNTNKPVQVVIDGCGKTSIEYVYGGGNAAATPATDVTVLGSYEIGSVFGGGNGKDRYTLDGGTTWNENLGADVGIINAAAYATDKSQGRYGTGNSMTSVLGGTVHNIFGGSNTLGNIVGEAIAYLDEASDCELNVDGIYGGGNEAYMDGSSGIQLGCIESLGEIYGGARKADVGGDINLTITSGHFDRVFGGNNLGGAIKGSITVNIEETGCNPITIGELYGCGNKAAYTTPEGKQDPTLNIRSFTSIGNVYGGGLGEEAVVTGNPTININVVKGDHNAVNYNEKTINFDDGSTVTLPLHETGKIGAIGNVFGGGNAAAVIGNTQVNIGTATSVVFESLTGTEAERTKAVEGADIRGNVYGGGNQAKVTGKTNVVIGQ